MVEEPEEKADMPKVKIELVNAEEDALHPLEQSVDDVETLAQPGKRQRFGTHSFTCKFDLYALWYGPKSSKTKVEK